MNYNDVILKYTYVNLYIEISGAWCMNRDLDLLIKTLKENVACQNDEATNLTKVDHILEGILS